MNYPDDVSANHPNFQDAIVCDECDAVDGCECDSYNEQDAMDDAADMAYDDRDVA